MSPGLPILYICAVAGLAIVVGSLLLLWKGRIYLDRETKQVVEIELPLGIRVKSSIPVLALIVIGGGLLVYSASEAAKIGEEVDMEGDLGRSTEPVELFAIVERQKVDRGGKFIVRVPVFHPSRKYELLYMADGIVLQQNFFDPSSETVLPPYEYAPPTGKKLAGDIDPIPAGY